MPFLWKGLLQKNHQTGLLAGGAGAPYERFAAGKTSAQAEFTSAEHFNPKGESRLWRLKPKKKGLPIGSPFFLERVTRLELATSTLARWRSTR